MLRGVKWRASRVAGALDLFILGCRRRAVDVRLRLALIKNIPWINDALKTTPWINDALKTTPWINDISCCQQSLGVSDPTAFLVFLGACLINACIL